jgi:hypothetical protein
MNVGKVYLQLHVDIIAIDAAHLKERVKGMTMMRSMMITKKRDGAVCEMIKILMWIETQ